MRSAAAAESIARLTTLFLAPVAVARFPRLVLQVNVVAGEVRVPQSASAVA